MKNKLLIIGLLAATSLGAQTTQSQQTVYADKTGVLKGPLTFFSANQATIASVAAAGFVDDAIDMASISNLEESLALKISIADAAATYAPINNPEFTGNAWFAGTVTNVGGSLFVAQDLGGDFVSTLGPSGLNVSSSGMSRRVAVTAEGIVSDDGSGTPALLNLTGHSHAITASGVLGDITVSSNYSGQFLAKDGGLLLNVTSSNEAPLALTNPAGPLNIEANTATFTTNGGLAIDGPLTLPALVQGPAASGTPLEIKAGPGGTILWDGDDDARLVVNNGGVGVDTGESGGRHALLDLQDGAAFMTLYDVYGESVSGGISFDHTEGAKLTSTLGVTIESAGVLFANAPSGMDVTVGEAAGSFYVHGGTGAATVSLQLDPEVGDVLVSSGTGASDRSVLLADGLVRVKSNDTLSLIAPGAVSGSATSTSIAGGASKLAVTNAEGNVNDLIDATDIDVAFARGLLTEVEDIMLPLAVPALATDTHNLKVGDGTTVGGHFVVPPGYTRDDFVTRIAATADGTVQLQSWSDGSIIQVGSGGGTDFSGGIQLQAPSMPIVLSSGTELYLSSGFGSFSLTNDETSFSQGLIAADDNLTLQSYNYLVTVQSPNGLLVNPAADEEVEGIHLGPDVTIYRSAADTFASNDTIKGFATAGTNRVGGFWSEAAGPRIGLYETDAGTNAKLWDIVSDSGTLRFRNVADNDTGGLTWLAVTRSGNSATGVTFSPAVTVASSTASSSSSTGALVVTGGVGVGGTINATGGVISNDQVGTSSALPYVSWYENDAGTDVKRWQARVDGGTFKLVTRNDANNAGADALTITRSGTAPSTVTFPGTANSSSTSTGAVVISNGLGVGGNLYAANVFPTGVLHLPTTTQSTNGRVWFDTAGNVIRYYGSGERVLVNTNATQTITNKTLSTGTTVSAAISFEDGVRQTFNPDATNAGINVGSVTSEPSAATEGDFWYRSDTGDLRAYVAGNARSIINSSQAQTMTNKTLVAPILSTTSSTAAGAIWYNSGTARLNYRTASDRVVVSETDAQTLTNKTLAAPTLTSYTVATLPTGSLGMMAIVTDATAPTYLGTLTGGGTVVCPVFHNGTAWVSH